MPPPPGKKPQKVARKTSVGAASKTSSKATSILVVEDDPLICKLLVAVLASQSDSVEVTNTFADATEAIERSARALIILDLGLPDGDGLDLLRYLRDELQRADPVLVLTAFRQEDKAVEAFNRGANDFISKPFAPRELVTRAQRLLMT
jgi:DNA-binding response OmpR family regulator